MLINYYAGINLCNCEPKGGVGKTTTSVNLGHALALMGVPTLLVDMDPQANATSCLGLERKPGFGIYEPLLYGSDVASRVISSKRKNLWVVPSELDLAAAELELSGQDEYLIKLRIAQFFEVRLRASGYSDRLPPTLGCFQ